MSVEIPSDLIREVQTQIREQLGIPQYDPDSLPSLPSIEDVIAVLDQSPAYLRCKRCKGRFLSGVKSLFCVYCGAERHDSEMPPEPIKFKSTFGYRWLLDALKLDGSEIVGQVKEENGSDRSQALPKKEELTVSELLDLEISWPERPKEVIQSGADSHLAQDKYPVNLAGVDIENFFPSSNEGVFASSSKGPEARVENERIDRSVSQGHEDVDLFANVPSVDNVSESNNDDGFSGWATAFQSSNYVDSKRERDYFDPFGASSGNLSVQMDSVSGSVKDLEVEISTGELAPSSTDKWNDDDLWSNFRSGAGAAGQPELLVTSTMEKQKVSGSGMPSNESDDWIIDNQWQTSSAKVQGNAKEDEGDDDSFDVWNDFSSSTNLQNIVAILHEQMPPESHASGINLFNSSNDLQDSDFGDFSQPDPFSSDHPTSAKRANHLHSETFVSDKMFDLNGECERQDGEGGQSLDEVEKIMSQMHDLSFMLESNLSISKT